MLAVVPWPTACVYRECNRLTFVISKGSLSAAISFHCVRGHQRGHCNMGVSHCRSDLSGQKLSGHLQQDFLYSILICDNINKERRVQGTKNYTWLAQFTHLLMWTKAIQRWEKNKNNHRCAYSVRLLRMALSSVLGFVTRHCKCMREILDSNYYLKISQGKPPGWPVLCMHLFRQLTFLTTHLH